MRAEVDQGGMAGQNTGKNLNQQRQGTKAGGVGPSVPSALDRVIGYLSDAGYPVDAGVRAAANTMSFGLADNASAGLDALPPSGDGSTWRQRYQANLAAEQARDRYDAIHHPLAQAIGQTIGAVVPLVAGDPEAALGAVARLPGAATLSGREAAAILAGGGGMGASAQHTSDTLAGRPPSLRNDIAGGLGGAAGAATLWLGPARAAAVDGAVTSAAQDILNDRPVSIERAGQNAMAGRLLGGAAGAFGRQQSNALSMTGKGKLGEALGEIRSRVNGTPRQWSPKTRTAIPGTSKYFYADGQSGDLFFEDKFGVAPKLTPNQQLAQEAFGPNFQIYHFTPGDVGKGVSVPAAAIGTHIVPQRKR